MTLVDLMTPMLGMQLTAIQDDPDEDCVSLVFGNRYLVQIKVDEDGDLQISAGEAATH